MKLLCFQAQRFRWKTHLKTLADVADQDIDATVEETLVAFIHAEARDTEEQSKNSVLRQAVKHLKWLANKRQLRNIVLHSFAHLGGETAAAELAESFIIAVAERLRGSGYQVWITPFGYFCEWDLSVYGESLAKVWKEIT
jgi:L-arabinose isomerase